MCILCLFFSVRRYIMLTYISFWDGSINRNTLCGNQWHGRCCLSNIPGQEMPDEDCTPQRLYKWESVSCRVSLYVCDSSNQNRSHGTHKIFSNSASLHSKSHQESFLQCPHLSILMPVAKASVQSWLLPPPDSILTLIAMYTFIWPPAALLSPFPLCCNSKWCCWGKSTAFANSRNMVEFYFWFLPPMWP